MQNKDQKAGETMRTNETKKLVPLPSSSHRLLLCFLAGVGLLFFLLFENAFAMDASWYSRADLIRDGQDKKTHFIMANGKEFKDDGLTCASWDYKLGTYIRVRNNENGKSIVVMVTDRTARRFKGKRVDLSKYAFSQIASCKQGIVPISVEEVK